MLQFGTNGKHFPLPAFSGLNLNPVFAVLSAWEQ
jgi:hypothetical protein